MIQTRLSSAISLMVMIVTVMAALSATGLAAESGSAGLDPALRISSVVKALDEGFLGRPWGARPGEFKDARLIAEIDPELIVYSGAFDLSPILGTVSPSSDPWLVFAKGGGLVEARIDFGDQDYDAVEGHLTRLLGNSDPRVYELWAARIDFGNRSEWLVGQNTRVVLVSRRLGSSVEISRRDFVTPEGPRLEDSIAAARLRQACEYERNNRTVEASSIYQELLNGTNSYRFFTPAAQERLAAYSQLDDATAYLGENQGLAFYGLNNVFADHSGQLWVRINLAAAARQELQKQQPDNVQPQDRDRLSNISAVLCRVRLIPAAGKYSVVEQVWLDGSGRIIGGRPAWAPQDIGWPAPFVKQACEAFLAGWFSVGNTTGPTKISGD